MTRLRLLAPWLSLAAVSCLDADKDPSRGIPVKVLFAVAQSDAGRFPDYRARIANGLPETQAVFTNSNTGVELIIADIAVVPFTPEERLLDLQRLVRRKDGHLDTLHALRDRAEADIVVLLSSLPAATINGATLATEATAFVVATWEDFGAPDYGLAHELGHLFGAMHDGATGPVADQFPQGFPFANDTLRTVIAYGTTKTVPYFSGPENLHHGTALGVPGKSDISSVIRATAAYVAGFRGPKPATDFIPAGTIPTLDYTE